MAVLGKGACDADPHLRGGVRRINDAERRLSERDERQRRADIVGLGKAWGERLPLPGLSSAARA